MREQARDAGAPRCFGPCTERGRDLRGCDGGSRSCDHASHFPPPTQPIAILLRTLLSMGSMFRRLAVLCVVPLALSACDGDDGEMDDGGDDVAADGGEHSDHGDHGDDGAQSACAEEDRDDFAIGVSRDGETMVVTVSDAMPSDPVRGDNMWMFDVADAQGNAIEGIDFVVKPWMPDHGHGTPVATEVMDMGAGTYHVEPINLFMRGLWEVRLELTVDDGPTEEIVFHACVE